MISNNSLFIKLEEIFKNKSIIVINTNDSASARVFFSSLILAINNCQRNSLKKLINSKVKLKNFDLNFGPLPMEDEYEFLRYVVDNNIEITSIDQSFLINPKSPSLMDGRVDRIDSIVKIFKLFAVNEFEDWTNIIYIQRGRSKLPQIDIKLKEISQIPIYIVNINENSIVFNYLNTEEIINIK